MANTGSSVGGRIIMQQQKNLKSRTQLDEPAECTSGGDPLLFYKILHLLFFFLWYRFFVHYALRVKKNYQHGLDAGLLEFQFLWPRRCLTNPFRTLSPCFRVTGKTSGLISHNNFVKEIFVCINHPDHFLARCDSIFPLLRSQGVWNNTCAQLSLSQILFQNLKSCSLGDVPRFCYNSWCESTVIFD
jgi:hypothetical protein